MNSDEPIEAFDLRTRLLQEKEADISQGIEVKEESANTATTIEYNNTTSTKEHNNTTSTVEQKITTSEMSSSANPNEAEHLVTPSGNTANSNTGLNSLPTNPEPAATIKNDNIIENPSDSKSSSDIMSNNNGSTNNTTNNNTGSTIANSNTEEARGALRRASSSGSTANRQSWHEVFDNNLGRELQTLFSREHLVGLYRSFSDTFRTDGGLGEMAGGRVGGSAEREGLLSSSANPTNNNLQPTEQAGGSSSSTSNPQQSSNYSTSQVTTSAGRDIPPPPPSADNSLIAGRGLISPPSLSAPNPLGGDSAPSVGGFAGDLIAGNTSALPTTSNTIGNASAEEIIRRGYRNRQRYILRLRVSCEVLMFLGLIHLGLFPDWWNGLTDITLAILTSVSAFRALSLTNLVAVFFLCVLNSLVQTISLMSLLKVEMMQLDGFYSADGAGGVIGYDSSTDQSSSSDTNSNKHSNEGDTKSGDHGSSESSGKDNTDIHVNDQPTSPGPVEMTHGEAEIAQQVYFIAYLVLLWLDIIAMAVTGNSAIKLLMEVFVVLVDSTSGTASLVQQVRQQRGNNNEEGEGTGNNNEGNTNNANNQSSILTIDEFLGGDSEVRGVRLDPTDSERSSEDSSPVVQGVESTNQVLVKNNKSSDKKKKSNKDESSLKNKKKSKRKEEPDDPSIPRNNPIGSTIEGSPITSVASSPNDIGGSSRPRTRTNSFGRPRTSSFSSNAGAKGSKDFFTGKAYRLEELQEPLLSAEDRELGNYDAIKKINCDDNV